MKAIESIKKLKESIKSQIETLIRHGADEAFESCPALESFGWWHYEYRSKYASSFCRGELVINGIEEGVYEIPRFIDTLTRDPEHNKHVQEEIDVLEKNIEVLTKARKFGEAENLDKKIAQLRGQKIDLSLCDLKLLGSTAKNVEEFVRAIPDHFLQILYGIGKEITVTSNGVTVKDKSYDY